MRERISILDAQDMLSDLLDELPKEFFHELHGGVILLDELKLHEESRSIPLYIMGEYRYQKGIGRSIVIYYRSFDKVYGHLGYDRFNKALRRVLRHEFRHHVETLAGSKDLIVEDHKQIEDYKRKYDSTRPLDNT